MVPDELKRIFANFPTVFKNSEIGRNNIGDYMKNYAIEKGLLKHSGRILTFCFEAKNETIIIPFFIFFLELGFVLLNIFLGNASIVSFNQWLMLDEKEMIRN